MYSESISAVQWICSCVADLRPVNHLDTMSTRPPPDRFSALLQFGLELVRTGESEVRHISRVVHNPERAILQWIEYRTQLLETITTLHSSMEEEEEAVPPLIRLSIPANWNEPVPVIASNERITESMREITSDMELGTCAICQEGIQQRADGCHLRNCGHQFHDNCILEWFTHSVRCPVCRNDIREDPDN